MNSTAMPLHLMISEKLREQIFQGNYPPKGQLPSEYDLGQQFGVSRTTVRRAIANLVNQGLVETYRGKGVFVKESQRVSFSLSNPLTFFNAELMRQGITGSIRTLCFDLVEPSAEISDRLHLSGSQEGEPQAGMPLVYQQQKIIFTNQVPTALDVAYFPMQVGAALVNPLQLGFTYATLDQNGFPLEGADVVLEGTHANPALAEYLEIPVGAPLLVYRYIAYTEGDRPVVAGEMLSRVDRVSYSVRLTRDDIRQGEKTGA